VEWGIYIKISNSNVVPRTEYFILIHFTLIISYMLLAL